MFAMIKHIMKLRIKTKTLVLKVFTNTIAGITACSIRLTVILILATMSVSTFITTLFYTAGLLVLTKQNVSLVKLKEKCPKYRYFWIWFFYVSEQRFSASNPAHGKVYSIQFDVIKIVSDLWQVCSTIQLTEVIEILLKVALNTLTI
jgi:hypothetical protein